MMNNTNQILGPNETTPTKNENGSTFAVNAVSSLPDCSATKGPPLS